MDSLREIYNDDRKKRVVFYRRAVDSFSFTEETWSDEQFEQCWIPSRWPNSFCDSLETAIREARGRIAWLDSAMANDGLNMQNRDLQ
jgi:hypothetical protein